jgi:hypothetical protein
MAGGQLGKAANGNCDYFDRLRRIRHAPLAPILTARESYKLMKEAANSGD